MKDYSNNVSLIYILWKWKYHIIIITGISIILAAVFSSSLFITPKFKSTAILYPSNITSYSDESETEQMLQIMQSKDIKDSVIKLFNLASHYEIDSNYKYFYTALYYEYGENVSISKTPYESVEISVLDKDPILASDIALAIIGYYDKKVRKLHNDKYWEVIQMYQVALDRKKAGIDLLQKKLTIFSNEYGLIDFGAQSLEITRGNLRTIMGASKANINQKEVDRLRNNIQEKGGELITLVESLKNEVRTYAELKVEFETAVRFYTDELTYSNIVSFPYPSDKKAHPVRWLIVVFTALATFFLTLFIILIIEKYRNRISEELNMVNNK